jgi:hypothetical protein
VPAVLAQAVCIAVLVGLIKETEIPTISSVTTNSESSIAYQTPPSGAQAEVLCSQLDWDKLPEGSGSCLMTWE